MNINRKWIIAAGTSVGIALAALNVSAQTTAPTPGGTGHTMKDGKHHKGHGAENKGKRNKAERDAFRDAVRQLTTREERMAFRTKMRAAKTPEERQQLAMANRTELQKRAAEKGITLPERRGPQGREGRGGRHGAPERTSSSPFPFSPTSTD